MPLLYKLIPPPIKRSRIVVGSGVVIPLSGETWSALARGVVATRKPLKVELKGGERRCGLRVATPPLLARTMSY
jgi:hypothetical protein